MNPTVETKQEATLEPTELFARVAQHSAPGMALRAYLIAMNIVHGELAARCGAKPSDLSMVIHGRRKTKWLRSALSRELGIPEELLFSDNR